MPSGFLMIRLISTGHIEKVPEKDKYLSAVKYYVMPHHAIWKQISVKT